MLVIRDAQMAALRDVRVAIFHRRLVGELQAEALVPGPEGRDADALTSLVAAASAAAFERGFAGEGDVRRFVRCAVRHGPSFPSGQPWARAIDRHPGLTPEQKLARFEAGPPR